MSAAIEVEGLSKLYRLGEFGADTIRESFDIWLNRLRGLRREPTPADREFKQDYHASQQGPRSDTFWALKDITFKVQAGEVLGIIGRNGAGKSTLLKVLSRITDPTAGRAVLRGRLTSLLEVGTGFHPELTGRENIYLNGAILGMRKKEIDKKFDQIIAFAELEKFLDTPVKHYSSGMYVRLAFAVAAHLETDILLVDEVLAVGDMAFQKKCLAKMRDFAGINRRTTIFVSHNMAAIESLCDRVLLLENGTIKASGPPREIVLKYLGETIEHDHQRDLSAVDRPAEMGDQFRFTSVSIRDEALKPLSRIKLGQAFFVCFTYRVNRPQQDVLVALRIETLWGQLLVDSWDRDRLRSELVGAGEYSVRVRIDPQDFHPGNYQITLIAAVHMVKFLDEVPAALKFSVESFSDDVMVQPERSALLYKRYQWHRERV